MEIAFVRHAEPEWVVDGRYRNDPRLTTAGRKQALDLASRLESRSGSCAFQHLLVSPAMRATETAAAVAEALGLDPVTLGWLVELRMPSVWEDQPFEVVSEAFELQATLPREAWLAQLPGAESLHDLHGRVAQGIEGVLAEWGVTRAPRTGVWQIGTGPQDVMVVAHAGTNSSLIAHLLGVEKEPWDPERFAMDHASCALLRTRPVEGGHRWELVSLDFPTSS